VVKDATAALSEEEMHAALDINLPNYVNAIVTTTEILEAICSLVPSPSGSPIHAAR
jgi:ureidoacrylate peracid hydrolase